MDQPKSRMGLLGREQERQPERLAFHSNLIMRDGGVFIRSVCSCCGLTLFSSTSKETESKHSNISHRNTRPVVDCY